MSRETQGIKQFIVKCGGTNPSRAITFQSPSQVASTARLAAALHQAMADIGRVAAALVVGLVVTKVPMEENIPSGTHQCSEVRLIGLFVYDRTCICQYLVIRYI
jgi:hypothetical protein